MSGPTGLHLFQQHFTSFSGQYVLIGGTAAYLAMDQAGLEFRATKDLDIVLIAEALTADFARAFWAFVEAGGYSTKEKSDGGRQFYRSSKPAVPGYPAMLELFSCGPDGLRYELPGVLTPLPFEEEVASLSAILLDDAYYQLLAEGTVRQNGLSWLSEHMLIPFKAKAWLDLSAQKASGAAVDGRHISKHFKDVLHLSRILPVGRQLVLPASVMGDLHQFLQLAKEGPDHTAAWGFPKSVTLSTMLDGIAAAYVVGTAPAGSAK